MVDSLDANDPEAHRQAEQLGALPTALQLKHAVELFNFAFREAKNLNDPFRPSSMLQPMCYRQTQDDSALAVHRTITILDFIGLNTFDYSECIFILHPCIHLF